MRWNRIIYKLGGTILFLFLLVLMPLGFVVDHIVTNFYYQKVQQDNEQLSKRIALSIAHYHNSMIVDIVRMVSGLTMVDLYVMDANGKVVVDNDQSLSQPSYQFMKSQLADLTKGKSVNLEYYDLPTKVHFFVSGQPIFYQHTFYGGVYIFSSVEMLKHSILKIRSLLFLSGIGAFLLAVGFTLVLSKKLSDPLLKMEQATRQIAAGNLDIRVNVASKDEIGSLAVAVNDLALSLHRLQTMQREFFANISHELRTPVTYLEGYIKIIKKGLYQTEEEKQEYLTIIQQEAVRLSRLIQDLFELSKLTENKLQLHYEWVDLVEVIYNSIQKVILKAQEKGLYIMQQGDLDVPLLYGDGLRLEQIFINLLDNAIRYTDTGGIAIKVQNMQSILKITVADTGIGIPSDELPHIFERFYRVEKSRSRQYGGTGLGLAIVKELVKLHDGTIQVFSEVGNGTSFEVQFPIRSNIEKIKAGEE